MGSGADGQERILDDFFGAKEVILGRHGATTRGQEELPRDHEERQILYHRLGGGKVRGKFPVRFSHAREDPQDTGGLAIVKLRLVFPLAKH